MSKSSGYYLPNKPKKPLAKQGEQSKIERMLAQQIIFSLFYYELLYLYNHALPSPYQKSCPYIARHQSNPQKINL